MTTVVAKKSGNTVMVELPNDLAEALGVAEGGVVAVERTATGVELRAEGVQPEFMEAHRESMVQFAELYKKLAQ